MTNSDIESELQTRETRKDQLEIIIAVLFSDDRYDDATKYIDELNLNAIRLREIKLFLGIIK